MKISHVQKYGILGFSLAEILITLLIIGIVASLVVPGLINDFKYSHYTTVLKEDFNILSNTTKLLKSENGGSLKNLCTGVSANYANIFNCYRDKFLSHLNHVKKCDTNNVIGNCYNGDIYDVSGTLQYRSANYLNSSTSAAILANGSVIFFNNISNDCNSNGGCVGCTIQMCSQIYVDTNGTKGPNRLGIDVYFLNLMDGLLVPAGTHDDWAQHREGICYLPGDLGYAMHTNTACWGEVCAKRVLKGDY